jgi:hypothetical protein
MEFSDRFIGESGLVISVVALLLAIPPMLQMIFGRPKIRIAVASSFEQGAQLLICSIYNMPIRNWFLNKIGIARSATDVFVLFDVREHGTNKIIANAFRPMLYDSKTSMKGLSLTINPSLPLCFTVVAHDDTGAMTEDHTPSENKRLKLPAGEYFADFKIASGETRVDAVAQSFTIGTDKEKTHWTARKITEQW